ncbi:Fanconi anemia group C protein [Erpetoichthys calabaricus]|uniref:FA complementation group C n=1 Tax=Erpetoichthys calabaricus TaxID=27687 RepID=A0A8C4RZX7_ERPCA|nr:Fanconi anemia group C protein [Erpetoichthys calabaricus]
MAQSSSSLADCVEYWLNKAVEWGQMSTLESIQNVCLHLQMLNDFLQQLSKDLHYMNTTVAIKKYPLVGQLLGRLCWIPCVVVSEECQKALLQCLWCLFSDKPQNAVELKANDWIKSLLQHLVSGPGDYSYSLDSFIRLLGYTPDEYYSSYLKHVVSSLVKELNRGNCTEPFIPVWLTPERLNSLSTLCIPLVTCSDAIPLISALLLHSKSDSEEMLNTDLFESINKALLQKKIVLEENVIMNLWLRYFPCFESAALNLIEVLISAQLSNPHEMEKVCKDSMLPKASACHPPLFHIVDYIFRFILLESEGSLKIQNFIRIFTHCVLQEQQFQTKLPLKAFFPLHSPCVLTALLLHPSGVPLHTWPKHLFYLSQTLKNSVQNMENIQFHKGVFENWFLLVHCGDWVDIAAQQLITLQIQPSDTLLWLLAFYHHPNNKNQQRTKLQAHARTVSDHLRTLFRCADLCVTQLQMALSFCAENPLHTHTKNLINQLLLNFLVFSNGGHKIAKDVIQKMMQGSQEDWIMLSSFQQRLKYFGLIDYKAQRTLDLLFDHLQNQPGDRPVEVICDYIP